MSRANLEEALDMSIPSYLQYRKRKLSKKDRCHKKEKCEWDGETLISDYVIIGGGTAGCLVARRLTDDKKSSAVLLEAGMNNDEDTLICCAGGRDLTQPNFLGIQIQAWNQYFWPDQTDWNQALPYPASRRLMFTTGRTFGGGSSVNGTVYVRPSRGLILEWQNKYLGGDPSWSPENVGRILKEIETYHGPSQDEGARGHQGPVSCRHTEVGAVEQAFVNGFVAAAEGTGAQVVTDFNTQPISGPELSIMAGFEFAQFPNYQRSSSSVSWLPEGVVRRVGQDADSKYAIGLNERKLLVLFKSTVLRILFDESKRPAKAIGVEWLLNGRVRRVYARRGVVVTAGIHTAQLLQVSGVGPRCVLEKANVKVIADNPNIGKRLIDHPLMTPYMYVPQAGLEPTDPASPFPAIAFLPDARVTLPGPLPPNVDPTRRAVEIYVGIDTAQTADGPETVATAIIEYVRPTSVGYDNIITGDPLHTSSTSYGFVSDDDLAGMTAVIQVYIAKFSAAMGYPLLEPTALDTATVQAWILSTVDTSFHYAASVTMGLPENGGGADGSGKVYGVDHLYVADDTLQPTPNDGNTHVNAYLIGYKVSEDLIKADAHRKSK